ncbi:hypothetical protein Tco_1545576, partial [Tanacetum coccineum]
VSSDDNESEAEEDDESDAERDESDEGKNVDIGKTDEEKTKSDDDEKRSVEQPMDEQVEVPVSATQQERPTLLQSTSSHSISSNFANQFLNSPNASLVGTIPKNNEAEIISMLDVHIQQEVPVLQQEPYQSVTVFVIPESTQQPPSTPPPPTTQPTPATTDTLATQVPNTEAVSSVAVSDFATPVINESVTATIQTKIKTQLPTILPEAISKVVVPMIQEALLMAPVVSTKSSAQPQSSYQAAETLTEFELKKILLEKIQRSQSYLTDDDTIIYTTLWCSLINWIKISLTPMVILFP